MSFLFVDRIVDFAAGEYIKGIKHVTADDPYLCTSWDGSIQFTPSLIGESLGQLAAWNVMSTNDFTQRPVAGIAAGARMLKPVSCGQSLVLESFIDKIDGEMVQYHSHAMVDGQRVFELDSAVGPLLPIKEFIDVDTVKNQFKHIMRPSPEIKLSNYYTPFNHPSTLNSHAHIDFDGIQEFNSGKSMTAVKLINKSAGYFADHFPLKPVLPLTVLLEAKIRLGVRFIEQSGLDKHLGPCEVVRVKMSDFVQPGEVLSCSLGIKSISDDTLVLTFKSEVNGKRVCVAEIKFSQLVGH